MKRTKLHIAFIELSGHREVLFNLLTLLEGEAIEISIFTEVEIWKDARTLQIGEKHKWITRPEKTSQSTFLHHQLPLISEHELVFLLTVNKDWSSYIKISQACPSVLLIHNVHYFLAPTQFFSGKPLLLFQQWIKKTVWWFRYISGAHKKIKKLIALQQNLLFLSEDILEYAQKNNLIPSGLAGDVLPYSFYEEGEPRAQNDALNVLIPGGIYPEMKNYKPFHQLLKTLKEEHLEKAYNFIFLGKIDSPDGRSFINSIQQYNRKGLTIRFFTEFIAQKEYINWLKKADLLIIPPKEWVHYGLFLERYGYSKFCGGINDMIRIGKPALLPEYYPLGKHWKDLVWTYSAENFVERFLEITNKETLVGKTKKGRGGLSFYNRNRQKEKLLSLIQDCADCR